jgi:hypothetical protein
MVDGLPGRKVVGQQAPGATAANDVEDGVKDLAQGMYPGSPGGFRDREMGLDVGPFGEKLAECKSLKGATMPNGQQYEDWLKDREGRGEHGENTGPS